jgi:uroporphyrin-III C-methyltransferase
LRLLREADVVMVDRLAPRALLDGLDPDVEVIDVGKIPYCGGATQIEIQRLLVERASRGLRVARLKGGDPFVFGRGGEEVAACAVAGVDIEVVPGVTSAVAAPGAAGIPVTHRGLSATLVVVSAQLASEPDPSPVDWPALAQLDATLVVLMGVRRLPRVVATLLEHGRAAETPAAVIEKATMEAQRVVEGPLAAIAERVAAARVEAPAVLVVGEVVRMRSAVFATTGLATTAGDR